MDPSSVYLSLVRSHGDSPFLPLTLSNQEAMNRQEADPVSDIQLSLDTQLINTNEASLKQTLFLNRLEQPLKYAKSDELKMATDLLAAIKSLRLQSGSTLLTILEDMAEKTIKYCTLASLPEQIIHGEKYYLTGNSPYEDAEIRCFAETHDLLATLDPVRWSFINNASSASDVAYIEGFSIDQKIENVANTSQLCELVLRSKNCRGWEPLETIESDEEYAICIQKYNRLKQAEQDLLNIPSNQMIIFTIKNKDVWERIKTPELKNLLIQTVQEKAKGKFNEDFHHLAKTFHLEVLNAVMDTTSSLLNKMQESIDKTFEIRQQSLFKACESNDWKIKYVVAGMKHFPTQLNTNDPQLESTQKYFGTKKYCVLISEQIVANAKSKIEESKQLLAEYLQSNNHFLNDAVKEALKKLDLQIDLLQK